jgi:hypothetical protein
MKTFKILIIEKTAKRLGISVQGKIEDVRCPDCALGKIRIKNFDHKDNEMTEKVWKDYFRHIKCQTY